MEKLLMRNKIILISILLALLLAPMVLAAPGEAYGNVTHVVDGDTFYVQIQGYDSRIGNITVRLADVDSPEMNTPEGRDSKNYTYQVLNGSFVSLDLDDDTGKDKYCRWVAVVFLQNQDGTTANFNKMLVESGHACIWDFSNNEFNPADWWNGQIPSGASIKGDSSIPIVAPPVSGSSSGPFIGSFESKKYHFPSCQWAKEIIPANVIKFNSSQDARNQGYVPCKVCAPT
jgi:micrococcal nuclease